jgi:hypothetical protein
VIATIAIAARKPQTIAQPSGTEDGRPAASGEVTLKLRSNVREARFVVDGKPIPGGVLRGAKGQTKKVMVEADGYAPLEAIVALEPDLDPPELTLTPRAADSVGGTATGARVEAESPSAKGTRSGAPKATAVASTKPSALTTALPAPTASATVHPAPSGTHTLTIKDD